jgi:uncharacterized SAM-binding protein YcdF (DUF218 family)
MTWRAAAAMVGVVLLLAVAGLGAGFATFVGVTQRPDLPPPQADGIVALTGGADRVETALHLLAAGRARLLLVSGVAGGASLAELARRSDLDPGPLAARVTLGREATTTLGNAEETAAWAQANAIRSLIVVTASYHMPRAMLELRRAMPGIRLYALPVRHPAMHWIGHLRLLFGEYAKLIGAWIGVSRGSGVVAAAVRHPVDKSVSGSAALLPG